MILLYITGVICGLGAATAAAESGEDLDDDQHDVTATRQKDRKHGERYKLCFTEEVGRNRTDDFNTEAFSFSVCSHYYCQMCNFLIQGS